MIIGEYNPNPTPAERRGHHLAICQKKTDYWTKAKAERAASYMKEMHGITLYAYKCPVCNDFHLSRKDPAMWKGEK